MRPIVHGLEREYWGQVDFVYLNTDKVVNAGLAFDYGLRGVPTYAFLEADGTVRKRWMGRVDPNTLRDFFDGYLIDHGL